MEMYLQSKGVVVKLLKPVVLRSFQDFCQLLRPLFHETTHAAFFTMYTVRILHSINARLHEITVAYYSVEECSMSLCKRSGNKVFVVDNMHGIVDISPQKDHAGIMNLNSARNEALELACS